VCLHNSHTISKSIICILQFRGNFYLQTVLLHILVWLHETSSQQVHSFVPLLLPFCYFSKIILCRHTHTFLDHSYIAVTVTDHVQLLWFVVLCSQHHNVYPFFCLKLSVSGSAMTLCTVHMQWQAYQIPLSLYFANSCNPQDKKLATAVKSECLHITASHTPNLRGTYCDLKLMSVILL
jgi:hypothetical protein